jgi:pimeloyl-ACP methyl ester carboxylesterase
MYAPNVAGSAGDDSARDWPEWSMPPQMIGGYVAGPVLIGRSDRVIVAARQVLAFPAGFEVEVEAHAQGSATSTPAVDPQELDRAAGLQFWLRFSDGRQAAQDDEAGLRSGRGPTLIVSGSQSSYGGPDSREDARLTLWAWPLPPPGPVTLTCTWLRHGLADMRLVLDGEVMRSAASRAQPFWAVPGR